jgi:hypothetical protein
MPDPVSPDTAVSPDTVSLVRALVTAAGLRPSEAEIEAMAVAYPALRAAADHLQAIAGDADPAPVFDPVPMFGARRGTGTRPS